MAVTIQQLLQLGTRKSRWSGVPTPNEEVNTDEFNISAPGLGSSDSRY